jgi:hypothetical protein
MKQKEFCVGMHISINDTMQRGYEYVLSAPIGKNFDSEFKPHFSPAEMLELGVFEGKYLNDCHDEFPEEWFERAKVSLDTPNIEYNYFKIQSRQPLSVWRQKSWIAPNDPDVRGWFQWYCRYYLGRRDQDLDIRQIKRWKSFARHQGQIRKNCASGNLNCRPRQRQALLQWSYDPFL